MRIHNLFREICFCRIVAGIRCFFSATNAQQSLATLQSMVDDIVTAEACWSSISTMLTANDGNNPSYEDLATLISYVKTYQEQGKSSVLA